MIQAQFVQLGSPESTVQLAEWIQTDVDVESVVCPANDRHQRVGRRLTDLSVVLPTRILNDIIWTWQNECLITDRVLDILRAKAFTGFEVKPARAVFRQSAEQPPRLWELIVTGWAGIANPESGITLVQHCEVCGQRTYSAWTRADKLFDEAQWDGSDICMLWPLPKHIFVTQRVAQEIRDSFITGAVLVPAADLVFPAKVIRQLSPGRLSYHMPDRRARELGEPLKIY